MAFNFDSWKKKDDKKRKSLDSQMPSFESFKSSRQTNVPQQKEFVSTFKNYEERKAARELDAQPAKSQKAKDADAARFAGSAMDRSPKSQKAKDADAARFGGGAQRQEEQRQEKVRDVKADRFAARYAPDVEINQPKKTEKAKSADDQRFAQRYSQENQKKVETARKEAMPATKINKPIEVAKTKSVDQKDRYDLGARAGQTGRTTKDKASIVKAAIGGYKAFTDKDNDNDTLSEKFGASVRLGIGDAVESAGDGVNYVAKKTQFGVENKDDMWLKAGQSMQKAGQNFREGFEDTVYDKEFSKESLSDSDWYATSLTRTIPNTLASLAPGLGAAKVLGTVNRIKNMPKIYKTIIQSVGGSGATTAYDSAVLSGGIYEEAKSRGMSEDEAIDAADQAFRRNALLTGGTTALEFGAGLLPFGKGISKLAKAGSIAGRTAGGAGLEAFQEGGQAAIEADALGDDFKWTDPSTIEAMVIGGLMGGTMTGSMATYRALQKDKTQQQNTNQDKPFNETTMEVEQGVERTEKVEDPKESILERVIEELPQERRDELDEGIFKLREEGFTYEDARDAIMETMVEDYPDVESTLADATIKYVKTKQREREVAGLENAPGEDVAARAKSFSPGEQVEFKGQNVTVKDVDGHQVEMETPDGKRFTADANAVNKVVNQEFDPLESDGDKVYEEMQSELAQEPVLEPVTEVVPKAAPKPSPKPKQPKTEPIDVVPGDDVQLQGTSANKGYKVEEVIGDEVKLTTPNNKTITVAKSKIVAKLNQQAQEESFDNEPTFEAAPEMGQSETAGNVELPPGFRNDVRNELNERVNDDGMTIDEAVQAMKEDDYYVDSPEWHGVIEEEAASSFGFKGKVQAAPEQEIIEDEVIAEETPKQELTKETEEPKAPVKPINFKLSKFEPRNSENDGIMGLSSDEGILTVRVMQSTTKEGLAALEELGFRFAKTEKVGTAKYFLFTKPSSGMKDFMETRKALKAYEPTSTIPKVEETTEPEEGQEPVVEKVAQVEISTSDWKPGDKALLGSSNREVTIESIKGTVVKAKNSLGKTVVTSLASLKREATETKVPLSEQGAKAQKEVIKNKVVDIPASLEDNALVNELKERVLAATGVDDVKAWNAVLQEVMQNKGIDPVQETHTLLINETVKKSKSVTNKQKSTKNLYTVKEYKSLDEVVLKDERNDNELTLNRSEIAKYMYFSNESVATIPFENVSLTVAKDGGNGTANKYTVKSKDNTFIVSTLEDKKAKAHAEEAAHRLRHVGRYFQAGYKILGFKIENKLTNSEFEILSVGMTPQGVEYKIKDLTTGHDAWFSPSLEDGQVYDIPMMKETHKKEKVIEKDNEVKEETKVKPLEKHVGDAIDFLETAVNQNGSMTFTKENKEAIHFEGVHGFDNEHNEEVKIQKSDGMIYTRPSSGGDWIESGVAYPPMAKEKESPAPTSDDPKNAKEVIQSFRKKMRDGDYTAKDLQEHFQYVKNNEEEVKAQFMDLLNNSDNWKRRRKDTKEKKVDELYDETLIRPLYGNSDMVSTRLDYFGKSAEERKASEIAQYEKQLSQITDESIAEYLEKQNAERAKEQKALDNPETLEEYRKKASSKDGLSAEEQAKYDELVALKTRELEAKKKTAAPTNSVSKGDYTIEPFKHTKTGEDLWVVKTPKVSKEDYPELARYMKSLGGGYSRFKKGFLFKEDPTAKLDGEISESEVVDLTESNQTRIADKLRAVADKMQETIDDKRRDTRKTNTHKRAREDANAREEADKMERQQGIMKRVADAIASGEATFLDNVTARTHFNTLDHILWLAKRERLNKPENQNLRPSEREKMEREPITVEEINAMELPKVNIYADNLQRIIKEMEGTSGLLRVLAKLTKEINAANANSNHMIDGEKNREDIMKVVDAAIKAGKEIYVAQAIKERYNDLKRLEAMKLNTPALLRSGIREYIRYTEDVGENTEQKEKDRKRKREAELAKMKIPGFFPTPNKLIDRMLVEADIQPGMTVLEPSAGKGNIAERIRNEHADATLDVVEYDYDLHEYLESLGYNVVGKDFMEHTGEYDRIVMNPPFEKGQDIDHVRHAYEMLKPGGRVVAIMSEGPFYRSDKKATSFREWLEESDIDGRSFKLDEGSFKDSERSTGVNTRLVVVNKPEAEVKAETDRERFRREYLEKEKELTKDFDQKSIAKAIKEKFSFNATDFPYDLMSEGIGEYDKQWTEEQMAQTRANEKTILSLMSDEDVLDFAAHGFERMNPEKYDMEAIKSRYMESLKNSGNYNGFINYSSNINKKSRVLIETRDGRKLEPTLDAMWKRYVKLLESKTKPEPKKEVFGGNTGEAFTENGTKIEFEYRVVEAADLIASNDSSGKVNPNYPQELQPRDRSRKASQVQIQNIAQKLNPVLVGESSKASDGAPIVGPDMVVESGNGRTIALKKMYEGNYDTVQTYDSFLAQNADKFGLDYDALESMEEPILVRVRTNEVDRKQFVHEANEASVSAMSAAEQATADAGKMNNKLMSLFVPGDNGELNTSSNRSFITSFMGDVVAKSERGRYMTSEGALSQEGLIRVRNAVFAKAYGNSEAVSLLAESTDNNVRNVTNAMLQSAPRFAIMKDAISNDALYNEDITGDIVEAMVKLADLRADGTSVQTFLDQTTMFDDMSLEAKEMLNIFDDKTFKRSAKALSELFGQYVSVLEAAGSPNQIKLFEDTPPTKAEILKVALKRVKVNEVGEVQNTLFTNETQSDDEARTTSRTKGPRASKNPHEEGFAGLKRKQEDNRRMDGTEEVDSEPIADLSRTKILQFINKEFKLTIGQGKLRGKQGVYKNKFSIIRTKEYGQFEVIAHELGHHLDKIARYSTNPKIRTELIKFAEANLQLPESMPKAQRAKEGVAEYYRQVFYNETAANVNIKDLSQGLKQEMADGLTKAKLVPQTYELKRMMSMWLNRDAKTELGGVVTRIGNKEKEKISVKRRIDKMYTNWFEEGHPIWRAIKDIEKETGKKIEGKNDAYALYRLTRGTTARAAAFTSGYSFDSDGNKTGESFEDILKEVDDLEEFGQYLVARRGLHLIEKRGKSKTPLSQDLMREHIKAESPKYQALAQRVYDYQDRLMHTTLVEGGLIDPELPEKLRKLDPYYVPFYRVMTEDGSTVNKGSGGSGGSIANQQQGIKRMKEQGSARDIINPIESIIKNTHLMFAITDRNSVGVALSELANPNSEFASEVARDIIEEIPNSFTVTDVALDQMKKALIDSGLDEDIMEELDLSQTAKVFNPLFKPNTSQNEILVWKEGKPKLYKIRDEMLYNALVVGDNVLLNKLTGSLLWKGAEASNKVLRWGIVSSPYFTARTFARSLFQMAIKTEATGLNYWTQPFELIKSMWSVVTKDNDMYDWWASGGAQSTFIAVENEYIDKSLNHLALNRKAWDMAKGRYKPKSKAERIEMSKYMAKSVVLSPFNLMSKVNDVLDQSLKLSEYNIMKKQTGDRQKSAIASRDADLDYRRMGAAGIKQYNSINLFFNVSLQGPDNIARTFMNHKVRTMVRGFSFLTIPTILLYLSNRDDEEYQELETWEKDMNWVWKLDDGKFLKVPIPFEVGILFKTLPEKIVGEMMDKMKGEDKHTWDNGFNNMAKTMIPSVLPTAAAIFANYKAKKDLTNDRPFVPMGLQSLSPEDQYNEKTSELMKWAGKVLNMSPMVLQETFNGQFGQMGTLGLFGADSLLSSIGVTEKRIDTKGILMSYSERYVKASVNDGGTASITSFYDKKKKLEEKKAKSGIKFYDSPELDSYQQANDDLRVLRKVRQELLSDKLTPGEGLKFTKEEKKYQVDAINNGMRDIARYVQGKEPIDPDSLQEALRIMDEYDAYTKMLDKEARRQAKILKRQDKANGQ